MYLVTEVEELLLLDKLIKGFAKINILKESVLEEVEAANSEIDSTNMP